MVLEFLAAPGLEHDRLGFLEASLRLGVVKTVTLIVVDVVGGTASQPDDQPTLADVVDQRELFSHPDRMMQRHLRHREADLRPFRGHRQRCGEAHRIDIGADPIEVMLGEPDHVEAQLIA